MKRLLSICSFILLYCFCLTTSVLADDKPIYNDYFVPKAIYDIPTNTPLGKNDQHQSVSPVTGALSLKQEDLLLPGRNGLDFRLVRSYNNSESNLIQPKVSSTYEPYDYQVTNYIVVAEYDVYYCFTHGCDFEHMAYEGSDADLYDFGTDHSSAEDLVNSINDTVSGSRYFIDYTDVYIKEYYTTESDYYEKYVNDKEPYTYKEKKYNLGSGWSWNFPSIELSGNQKYLHLEDGSAYRITSDNKLEDYLLNDLKFESTSEVVGTDTAVYKLSNTKKISYYFNSQGYWIGTKDAYNNQITVSYKNTPINGGTTTSLLIDKIIDSVGRDIQFSYFTNLITVSYSDKIIKFNKIPIPNETNEMYLSSVINESGEETKYDYSFDQTSFSFTTSGTPISIKYANLKWVTYPTGSKTIYSYQQATKNLGNTGTINYYRVEKAYDELNGLESNLVEYFYDSNNFSGYPTHRNPDNLPDSFTYQNSYKLMTDLNQTTPKISLEIKDKFNYQHLNIESTKEKEKELKHVTTQVYNNLKLPKDITKLAYDPINGGSSLTISSFTYDNYGNILTETNPKGHVTTFTYSPEFPSLWKTKQVTVNGVVTENIEQNISTTKPEVDWKKTYFTENGSSKNTFTDFSYDSYGNLISIVFDLENNKKSKTDINYLPETKYAYPSGVKTYVTSTNHLGENVSETIEENFKYDMGTGRIIHYYDGNAVKKGAPATSGYDYLYDNVGRLLEIKHPLVTEETVRTTQSANYAINTTTQQFQIEETDEEGYTTQRIFDGLNRLIEEKNTGPDGKIRTIKTTGYNDLGQIKHEVDARNLKTEYSYDPIGRVKQTSYPDGTFDTKYYNDVNRTVKTIDERGNEETKYLDELDRTIRIEKKDNKTNKVISSSTHYEYTNPFQVLETDYRGNATTLVYNELDQLTKVIQTTSGISQESSYKYNLLGKISESLADSKKLLFEYDELGRLIKRIDGLQKSNTYRYDHNDNVIEEKDRKGVILSQTYDEKDRLVEKVKGTQKIEYTYYLDGTRKSMEDSTGITNYTYYPDQSVNSLTYPDGKKISYQYHPTGQVSNIKEPFGETWEYRLDNRNRIDTIHLNGSTSNVTDYEYHPNGLIWKATQGNGIQGTWEFDGFNNLTSLTYKNSSGSIINTFSYFHDDNGNITSRTQNGVNNTYTYDELDRILTNSDGVETYTYDKNGNRQTLTTNQKPSLNNSIYTFNEWNQLTQVKKGANVVGEYKYNGDGQLVEKKQNGVITRYYYDGDQVIAEGKVTSTGVELIARYLRGHDTSLVYREDSTNKKGYYIHNGHGDVVALRNEVGNSLNSYTYDIWGNSKTTSETMPNPFRYSGELWDSATNLQYLRARWYDPSIGRFISEDTFEGDYKNPLSLNLYTYVENNPLSYNDPTGNSKKNIQQLKDAGLTSSVSGALGMPKVNIVKAVAKTLKQITKIFDGQDGGSKGTGDKVLTKNGAFRDAKRRAGIPNSTQHKKPVDVYDGTTENRRVYEFKVDGKKKYIIEHREDKFGRGPHFHGADDFKGSPLEKGKYNQYPGHSPEDFVGYKKKGRP
jgi:RHS repeat-associated protein